MPWIEVMLRGQRVIARVNGEGSLAADNGKVEIRYKATDGRLYHAAARNLETIPGARVLPDEACGPAAPVPKAKKDSDTGASRGAPSEDVRRTADAWLAYTDGACSGNPGPAGCGVVLVSPSGKLHEGIEYLGQATNNVAELTAILRAVEWTPTQAASLVVHTDSQYAIGVLQKGWKAKANVQLVANTKEVVRARGARLVYVPGHRGVALNERADELAREAVQTRRSRVALVD